MISTSSGTVQINQAKTLQFLQQQQRHQLMKQQQQRRAQALQTQSAAIAAAASQNKSIAVTTPLINTQFATAAAATSGGATQLRMSKDLQAMTVAPAGGGNAQKRLDMQLLLNRQNQAKLLQTGSVQQASSSPQPQVRQVQVSQSALAAASRVSRHYIVGCYYPT